MRLGPHSGGLSDRSHLPDLWHLRAMRYEQFYLLLQRWRQDALRTTPQQSPRQRVSREIRSAESPTATSRPPARVNVQSSVTSPGALPSISRPVARSTIRSISEKRMATVA